MMVNGDNDDVVGCAWSEERRELLGPHRRRAWKDDLRKDLTPRLLSLTCIFRIFNS